MLIKSRESVAIVYKDCKYSYKQLLQYSLLYKDHFSSLVSNLERVMIFSENTPEYTFAIYGTLRNKSVTVPVDVMSTAKELKYIMNDCKPEIIFVTQQKKQFVEECAAQVDNYNPIILTPEDIDTSKVDSTPVVDIEMGDNDQTVTIIYTSGTTGSPKGVMLSYKNFWYNIDAVVNQVDIMNESSRVMMILPLHHVFSYAGCLLAPLFAGSTIYIADGISPEVILRTLQQGRITTLIGVPRLYEGFAKGIMSKINSNFLTKSLYKLASTIGSRAFSKFIFKSVHAKFGGCMEYFVSGGAALPYETGKIFKTLGFYILEGYGMTECAPMIAFTRPGEWKIGYCGRLLKGVEMRVEQNGELCVKGPNVMQGYYNRPQETAQIIKDGWLYTGDTGVLDSTYGVKITGRTKEIIVTSNGKNINPAEIENELTQLSYVIKEVAITLREDALHAIVYPDMNAARANTGATIYESIKQEVEKYNLGAMNYKRIKRFHIVSQELPKTRLGKIQRYMLDSLINESSSCENAPTTEENLEEKSPIYIKLKQFIDGETQQNAKQNDHFEIDLSLDSLGRVSFISFIEESFNIQIKEEQLDQLSTLNKLSQYIETHSSVDMNIDDTPNTNMSWKEIFEMSDQSLTLPKSGFLHWFSTVTVSALLHTIYNYKVSGQREQPNTPAIYVGNHRSALDGVLITSKLKWKTVGNTLFFAKKKHFNSKAKEFWAHRNNVIVMDINTNVRSSLQQMYQVLQKGRNIIIFPEGTRSKDGTLNEFKDGFAILAQALNVPVIPVAIKGAEKATYKRMKFLRLFSKIEVSFLPAIYSNERETVKEFNNKVYNTLKKALEGSHK